ncbi:unnamed protein product [Closterium sp. NIES-53]
MLLLQAVQLVAMVGVAAGVYSSAWMLIQSLELRLLPFCDTQGNRHLKFTSEKPDSLSASPSVLPQQHEPLFLSTVARPPTRSPPRHSPLDTLFPSSPPAALASAVRCRPCPDHAECSKGVAKCRPSYSPASGYNRPRYSRASDRSGLGATFGQTSGSSGSGSSGSRSDSGSGSGSGSTTRGLEDSNSGGKITWWYALVSSSPACVPDPIVDRQVAALERDVVGWACQKRAWQMCAGAPASLADGIRRATQFVLQMIMNSTGAVYRGEGGGICSAGDEKACWWVNMEGDSFVERSGSGYVSEWEVREALDLPMAPASAFSFQSSASGSASTAVPVPVLAEAASSLAGSILDDWQQEKQQQEEEQQHLQEQQQQKQQEGVSQEAESGLSKQERDFLVALVADRAFARVQSGATLLRPGRREKTFTCPDELAQELVSNSCWSWHVAASHWLDLLLALPCGILFAVAGLMIKRRREWEETVRTTYSHVCVLLQQAAEDAESWRTQTGYAGQSWVMEEALRVHLFPPPVGVHPFFYSPSTVFGTVQVAIVQWSEKRRQGAVERLWREVQQWVEGDNIILVYPRVVADATKVVWEWQGKFMGCECQCTGFVAFKWLGTGYGDWNGCMYLCV